MTILAAKFDNRLQRPGCFVPAPTGSLPLYPAGRL